MDKWLEEEIWKLRDRSRQTETLRSKI